MAHHSLDAATGFAADQAQAAGVWKTVAGHTSLSTALVLGTESSGKVDDLTYLGMSSSNVYNVLTFIPEPLSWICNSLRPPCFTITWMEVDLASKL